MRLNRESARMEAVQCSVVGEREDLRAQVSHRGAGGGGNGLDFQTHDGRSSFSIALAGGGQASEIMWVGSHQACDSWQRRGMGHSLDGCRSLLDHRCCTTVGEKLIWGTREERGGQGGGGGGGTNPCVKPVPRSCLVRFP